MAKSKEYQKRYYEEKKSGITTSVSYKSLLTNGKVRRISPQKLKEGMVIAPRTVDNSGKIVVLPLKRVNEINGSTFNLDGWVSSDITLTKVKKSKKQVVIEGRLASGILVRKTIKNNEFIFRRTKKGQYKSDK